jgi:RHS repeat-associated protein
VSAFGVNAQMKGSTENATTIDLPGGVQALYSGGSLQRFRFPDWQGTIRAESNPSTRAFTESLAFAPFGERYAVKGAPYNVDSFTGKPDQMVSDEYDFPARQEHGGQGRWVSPDPMRGTGNKYVYADNNPLSNVDLYGLFTYVGTIDPNLQAWIDSELNRPDPLSESRGPGSGQNGPGVFGVSENAYLDRVDFAFEADVSVETPPVLQRNQAAAQNQANGAGQAHGAGQQGDVATANHYLSRSNEMRLVEKAFKSGHSISKSFMMGGTDMIPRREPYIGILTARYKQLKEAIRPLRLA